MEEITQRDILTFLYYGYLPTNRDVGSRLPLWLQPVKDESNNHISLSETELIDLGCKKINALFSSSRSDDNKIHVLPLSGGLDSRTILAGLIKLGLKDKIITVTFGTPGTYDFEFGNLVASYAGTKHENIDLTKEIITLENFLKSKTDNEQWTYLFDNYYNKLIPERFGANVIYWCGFMGGELAGAHLQLENINTWTKARKHFAHSQKFVKSFNLCPDFYTPEAILPKNCFLDDEKLSYYEQIDFVCRQPNYIFPTLTKSGYDYRLPFIDENWVKYILSIPRYLRKNKMLYKLIIKREYPDFFSLPSTAQPGFHRFSHLINKITKKFSRRLTWGVPKTLNYIDFDEAIRKREDYKTLVYDSLISIKKMELLPWIDLEELWKKHQKREKNYGDALTLLTSLDILIKKTKK